ncbi:SRPBCC family protein [Gynurincola endophyticus]|uniref:SRPBCC family protein n=1 Tax=Gynurincola endophyticus TaxID=2479004 RepID=UPI000F8DD0F8|nr:SRPBCC domain-containing protein [Gynurincola endophyticus]
MHDIEHINYIKVPATVVYEALTTEAGLGNIWTNKLTVKPEIGFINEFDFNEEVITKMKVMELKEGQRVVWECVDSDQEWRGTSVSFVLSEEKEGVTQIILKHSDWRVLTDYYRWCNYNWAMFLYRLKNYCEALYNKAQNNNTPEKQSATADEKNDPSDKTASAEKNKNDTDTIHQQTADKAAKQRVVVGNEQTAPAGKESEQATAAAEEATEEINTNSEENSDKQKKQRVIVGKDVDQKNVEPVDENKNQTAADNIAGKDKTMIDSEQSSEEEPGDQDNDSGEEPDDKKSEA